MTIKEILYQDTVSMLESYDVVLIPPTSTIQDAIQKLQDKGRGSILIGDTKKIEGIFTERDVLMKVYGEQLDLDQPVSNVMSTGLMTVELKDSVASVIKKMRNGGYRHLPVVDEQDCPVRIISIKHIVRYFTDYFAKAVYNLPPDPDPTFSSEEGA